MGIKINEYPLERLTFGDDDFYDIDYWDGATYQTAKIKGSTIKAGIQSAVNNIYNNDGTLSADRQVTGGNHELFFQELGKFIVHSHANNIDNVEFEVRSQASFKSFNIKDHTSGLSLLSIENGKVKINGAYDLPTADGTNGQVIVTDGAGNLSFATLTITDTNIYKDDGALTGNRTMNMGNYSLDLNDGLSLFIQCANTNPSESIKFQTLEDSNRHGFQIIDQESNVIFGTFDGYTRIHDAYNLPKVDAPGPNYLLTSDGGGQASWIQSTNIRQDESLIVACSDETTVLSVSSPNAVITFRSAYEMTISNLRTSLTTPGTGGGVTEVDITVNGTTIFSTRLSIDSGQTTSLSASTPYVLSTLPTIIPDNAEIKVIITAITNEPTETGLKLMINNTRG